MIFYNANIRKLHPWYYTTNSENAFPFFRDIKRYNSTAPIHYHIVILLYYDSITVLFLFVIYIKNPVIITITVNIKKSRAVISHRVNSK